MASGFLYLTFGVAVVVMLSSVGVKSQHVDLAQNFEGRNLVVVKRINSNDPENFLVNNPMSLYNLKRRRRDTAVKPTLEAEILNTGIENNPSSLAGPVKRSHNMERQWHMYHRTEDDMDDDMDDEEEEEELAECISQTWGPCYHSHECCSNGCFTFGLGRLVGGCLAMDSTYRPGDPGMLLP